MTADLHTLLMSIRFSNPEMAYFQEHQVMNDNWEEITKIILWSIKVGYIVPVNDAQTGKFKYECRSTVVEEIMRTLLAFGRGSFFSKQPLETQATMAAVVDASGGGSGKPPQSKRKKR